MSTTSGITQLSAMQSLDQCVGTARSFTKWTAGISFVAFLVIKGASLYHSIYSDNTSSRFHARKEAEKRAIPVIIIGGIFVISVLTYIVTIPTQWVNHRIITHLKG